MFANNFFTPLHPQIIPSLCNTDHHQLFSTAIDLMMSFLFPGFCWVWTINPSVTLVLFFFFLRRCGSSSNRFLPHRKRCYISVRPLNFDLPSIGSPTKSSCFAGIWYNLSCWGIQATTSQQDWTLCWHSVHPHPFIRFDLVVSPPPPSPRHKSK